MYRPVDVPFDDLALDHVRSFLAEADEEGVNWEAKADGGEEAPEKRLRSQHVQHSACALTNQIGGWVLVGAKRVDGEWRLPGVQPPSEEMGLWLDQVLEQLRPAPRYRHKVWKLQEGRVAAVVEVEPLSETPCMTADGQVFERVSSMTQRVTDPDRLADLYRRGREARGEAESRADRAVTALLEHPEMQGHGKSVWVSVGMGAASYEPDVASRLFHERFNRELRRSIGYHPFTVLASDASGFEPFWEISQSTVDFGLAADNLSWLGRGTWDGSGAAIAGLGGSLVEAFSVIDCVVVPAWKVAADLVLAVGGYGDSHVTVALRVVQAVVEPREPATLDLREVERLSQGQPPPRRTLYGRLPEQVVIKRSTGVRGPTEDEIRSVQRELQRAAGLWTFEGVPDPPPT